MPTALHYNRELIALPCAKHGRVTENEVPRCVRDTPVSRMPHPAKLWQLFATILEPKLRAKARCGIQLGEESAITVPGCHLSPECDAPSISANLLQVERLRVAGNVNRVTHGRHDAVTRYLLFRDRSKHYEVRRRTSRISTDRSTRPHLVRTRPKAFMESSLRSGRPGGKAPPKPCELGSVNAIHGIAAVSSVNRP